MWRSFLPFIHFNSFFNYSISFHSISSLHNHSPVCCCMNVAITMSHYSSIWLSWQYHSFSYDTQADRTYVQTNECVCVCGSVSLFKFKWQQKLTFNTFIIVSKHAYVEYMCRQIDFIVSHHKPINRVSTLHLPLAHFAISPPPLLSPPSLAAKISQSFWYYHSYGSCHTNIISREFVEAK